MKCIDRSTYLQALALYTLAFNKIKSAEECKTELCKLLGLDEREYEDSHISDAIFGSQGFDEALKLSKISVEV